MRPLAFTATWPTLGSSAVALALALGVAGAANAETLAEAVALAYQGNPAIQAQRAQLRALNETYVQTRSNFGPRLSAEVDLGTQSLTEKAGGKERTFSGEGSTENFTFSQPLFTGGRVGSALDAAEADVRAGRERVRQAEADLLQRVVAAYVSVRRDQQILVVARSTATVLQQQLEETRAKTEVKENTRTDLAQAEARLAGAQAQVYSAEAQLANSRAAYLNAVGQNPGELAPEPDLPGLPSSVDKAFEAAEADNMLLRASKYAELGSRARVTAARAQNLPSVALRLQAARQPTALYFPNPYLNTVTAQALITQPLFTAGQNGSVIRRAVETNNSDRLLIDSTRRNVVQTVSQQWNQLSAARSALIADQANVTASETAFFGMRQEERFGLRSTIELLNAQQELTSAQIGLLRDRYNEYTARVGVLNAMGRLTVDALAPSTPAFDMVKDFNRVKNKGALPLELVPRILDAAVKPSLGPPAAARETATPDQQMPLPAAPLPASEAPPLRSVTSLMEETRQPAPGQAAP